MRTRKKINSLIDSKNIRIKNIQKEIRDLEIESLLLSDKNQWFTENEEEVILKDGRRKIKQKHLIGRIHWEEDFVDEDTMEVISIELSRVVRRNGIWNS